MPSHRGRAAKEATQQSCSTDFRTRRRSAPTRAAHEVATPEGGEKRAAEPLHSSQPSQTSLNRNRAMREHDTSARPQYSCGHVATFGYTPNQSIALYCIALQCIVLPSIAQSWLLMHCITLYRIVSHCTVLHCLALCSIVGLSLV